MYKWIVCIVSTSLSLSTLAVARESSLKICATTIKIRGGDGNVVSPDPLLAKNNEDVRRRRNKFNLLSSPILSRWRNKRERLTKRPIDKLNEKLEEARRKFFDSMAAVSLTLINQEQDATLYNGTFVDGNDDEVTPQSNLLLPNRRFLW